MVVQKISIYIMPFIFITILGYALFKKVNIFDTFLKGASNGLKTSVNILPALVGLICAVSMLRASGALDFLEKMLSPLLSKVSMPNEVLPLALLKSVSGSGALALIKDIFDTHGPDSFAGKVASVMLGSSETTFYTLAVYYGAVKIKNSRHTVPAAIVADIAGIVAAVYICNLIY